MDENIDKQNYLAKFNLCKSLVLLVGKEQATADLDYLYEHHKYDKMFNNKEEVRALIKEVLKEPEIITKAKTENATLAAKRLNQPNKMGEVVVVNNEAKIIHANKKRIKEFRKIIKDSLVETPTPPTHRQSPTGELIAQDELSGANARSANPNEIISQPKPQSQIDSKESKIAEMKEKVKNVINGDKTQINKDKSLDIDR